MDEGDLSGYLDKSDHQEEGLIANKCGLELSEICLSENIESVSGSEICGNK